VDDLVRWLTAQLDEDERIARAAEGDPVFDGTGIVIERNRARGFPDRVAGLISPVATHISVHDPARVLRKIDAKRRIVDRYAWLREHGDTGGTGWVLQVLALPYENRPGYQESWRP